MRKFYDRITLGLTPPQLAAVGAVFIVTLIGAILLAWALRRYNRRRAAWY